MKKIPGLPRKTTEERYRFIAEHPEHSVERLCRLCEVSRGGYYKWYKRPISRRKVYDAELLDRIIDIRLKRPIKQCYGSPRLYRELVGIGLKCGENRVARIMRENGIKAKIKRKRVITTNAKHGHPFVDNRVNQRFSVTVPNKVYGSDITYVRTQKGWLYLAVVMDLYSRKVIGWATSSRLVPWVAVKALHRACKARSPQAGTIIHSDRGSQYASFEFELLASCYRFNRSMNSTGNCYDNAVLESFFHSLKSEWLSWHTFKDREDAADSIFEYIETFYNRDRRHSTLGYLSPIEYEEMGASLDKVKK